MFKVLRDWIQRYFSDEEAVVLAVLLFLAFTAVLKVTATDAGSQRDFRTFARLAGHTLLREEDENGVYRYWLQKA